MHELLRIKGYHVYFWLNEGIPLEPIHVRVSKNIHKNATKIWIQKNGTCRMAKNNDKIPIKELMKIEDTITLYHQEIFQQWQERFGKINFIDAQMTR